MRDLAAFIVLASWLAFIPVMARQFSGRLGNATRHSPLSTLGVVVTAIGFALVWMRASSSTPPWALAPAIGAGIAMVSAAFGLWAIVVLGKQWSVQARLRTDHELVTVGPYAWVRHPIYLAFFGMLAATGLVFVPSWVRLLAAVVLYWFGTALRMRSEDGLLRERFGPEFDDYARHTPAVIPNPWIHRAR